MIKRKPNCFDIIAWNTHNGTTKEKANILCLRMMSALFFECLFTISCIQQLKMHFIMKVIKVMLWTDMCLLTKIYLLPIFSSKIKTIERHIFYILTAQMYRQQHIILSEEHTFKIFYSLGIFSIPKGNSFSKDRDNCFLGRQNDLKLSSTINFLLISSCAVCIWLLQLNIWNSARQIVLHKVTL